MKVSINTLYFPNSNPEFTGAHKSVMQHFGVKVNYHEVQLPHGMWMDSVIHSSNADVVGFIDIDCIPLNANAINDVVSFVARNKSIAGGVS